jgi:hypothetical protein
MPVHACGFRALGGTLIPGISKHDLLIAVQQTMSLGDVMYIGRSADDGVYQAGISIHTNVNTKGLPASGR